MKNEKLNKPVPIRMNESLIEDINVAADKLEYSQQETIRLLIRIGLACLEINGYNLPKHIAERVSKK